MLTITRCSVAAWTRAGAFGAGMGLSLSCADDAGQVVLTSGDAPSASGSQVTTASGLGTGDGSTSGTGSNAAGTATPSGATSAVSSPSATLTSSASASATIPSPYSGVVGAEGQELWGAPLSFAPTDAAIGLSAVLGKGDAATLTARLRVEGAESWGEITAANGRDAKVAEWRFEGLDAATRYEYQVLAGQDEAQVVLYEGSAVTRRPAGDSFTFAMIADSHIGQDLAFSNQGTPTVLAEIGNQLAAARPDFLLNLGDLLDYHQFGFNVPPPDASVARSAYLNYRSLLGPSLGVTSHFGVIGNWDGENGEFTPDEIAISREQRMLLLPNPAPETNVQGGSPNQDYYAFTWGDALFVVLNVMTYTTTPHLLSTGSAGLPDDWTLGEDQLAWLATTLQESTAKWKFTFIHHTVGGKAGDEENSAYGRGGGQAAYIGEQGTIHQLLQETGVQVFFYGHDHVFTDMVVDGVHYTSPGSAGAPWIFDTEETGYTQYWGDSGWTSVDVTPSSAHVAFRSINGSVLYEYTLGEASVGVDAGAADGGPLLPDSSTPPALDSSLLSVDASDSGD